MQEQNELLNDTKVDQTEDSLHVAKIIKTMDIKCFVEIGVSVGGSIAFYSYSLPKDCMIIGIDLYDSILPEYENIIRDNCGAPIAIKGDSKEPDTYDRLIDIIGTRSIDFLHIDGDHTYEGVRSDFEIYAPLVSDGGIIVLHDIHSNEGVKKFWTQLENSPFNTKVAECSNPKIYSNAGIIFY
jgi:cephalosporin hydroxylase